MKRIVMFVSIVLLFREIKPFELDLQASFPSIDLAVFDGTDHFSISEAAINQFSEDLKKDLAEEQKDIKIKEIVKNIFSRERSVCTKKKPEIDQFETEEEFLHAFGKWRAGREKNQEQTKKSRKKTSEEREAMLATLLSSKDQEVDVSLSHESSSKGSRKQKVSKEPLRESFGTEKKFLSAWTQWRARRDKNNELARRWRMRKSIKDKALMVGILLNDEQIEEKIAEVLEGGE